MPPDELITDAVILAGGLGTRLAPLTDAMPKALVQVKGRPFIAHQLEMLRRRGISDVLILTGHLGDQIESVLGTGEALGLRLKYSREPSPIGTGGAVANAKDLLPEEFVLVYGDSYLDLDYQEMARIFRSQRGPDPAGLMVVSNALGPDDVGNVKLDRTGTRVVSYSKGAGGDHSYLDAGVLIFTRSMVVFIPQGVHAMLEDCVYPRMAREGRLIASATRAKFYDIGTSERLAVFERSLS